MRESNDCVDENKSNLVKELINDERHINAKHERLRKLSRKEFVSTKIQREYEIHLRLAQNFFLKGQNKDAEKEAVSALRLRPTAHICALFAAIAESQGEYSRASDFRLLQAFLARDVELWEELLHEFLSEQLYYKAVICLQRLSALENNNAERYRMLQLQLADLFVGLGEIQRATNVLVPLWNSSKCRDFEIFALLAGLYFQLGKWNSLQRLIESSLRYAFKLNFTTNEEDGSGAERMKSVKINEGVGDEMKNNTSTITVESQERISHSNNVNNTSILTINASVNNNSSNNDFDEEKNLNTAFSSEYDKSTDIYEDDKYRGKHLSESSATINQGANTQSKRVAKRVRFFGIDDDDDDDDDDAVVNKKNFEESYQEKRNIYPNSSSFSNHFSEINLQEDEYKNWSVNDKCDEINNNIVNEKEREHSKALNEINTERVNANFEHENKTSNNISHQTQQQQQLTSYIAEEEFSFDEHVMLSTSTYVKKNNHEANNKHSFVLSSTCDNSVNHNTEAFRDEEFASDATNSIYTEFSRNQTKMFNINFDDVSTPEAAKLAAQMVRNMYGEVVVFKNQNTRRNFLTLVNVHAELLNERGKYWETIRLLQHSSACLQITLLELPPDLLVRLGTAYAFIGNHTVQCEEIMEYVLNNYSIEEYGDVLLDAAINLQKVGLYTNAISIYVKLSQFFASQLSCKNKELAICQTTNEKSNYNKNSYIISALEEEIDNIKTILCTSLSGHAHCMYALESITESYQLALEAFTLHSEHLESRLLLGKIMYYHQNNLEDAVTVLTPKVHEPVLQRIQLGIFLVRLFRHASKFVEAVALGVSIFDLILNSYDDGDNESVAPGSIKRSTLSLQLPSMSRASSAIVAANTLIGKANFDTMQSAMSNVTNNWRRNETLLSTSMAASIRASSSVFQQELNRRGQGALTTTIYGSSAAAASRAASAVNKDDQSEWSESLSQQNASYIFRFHRKRQPRKQFFTNSISLKRSNTNKIIDKNKDNRFSENDEKEWSRNTFTTQKEEQEETENLHNLVSHSCNNTIKHDNKRKSNVLKEELEEYKEQESLNTSSETLLKTTVKHTSENNVGTTEQYVNNNCLSKEKSNDSNNHQDYCQYTIVRKEETQKHTCVNNMEEEAKRETTVLSTSSISSSLVEEANEKKASFELKEDKEFNYVEEKAIEEWEEEVIPSLEEICKNFNDPVMASLFMNVTTQNPITMSGAESTNNENTAIGFDNEHISSRLEQENEHEKSCQKTNYEDVKQLNSYVDNRYVNTSDNERNATCTQTFDGSENNNNNNSNNNNNNNINSFDNSKITTQEVIAAIGQRSLLELAVNIVDCYTLLDKFTEAKEFASLAVSRFARRKLFRQMGNALERPLRLAILRAALTAEQSEDAYRIGLRLLQEDSTTDERNEVFELLHGVLNTCEDRSSILYRLFMEGACDVPLIVLLANRYYQTRSFSRVLNLYLITLKERPTDVLLNFLVGLAYLLCSHQKPSRQREGCVSAGMYYLHQYQNLMIALNEQRTGETMYNCARALHYLRLYYLCVPLYKEIAFALPIPSHCTADLRHASQFNLYWIYYHNSGNRELGLANLPRLVL